MLTKHDRLSISLSRCPERDLRADLTTTVCLPRRRRLLLSTVSIERTKTETSFRIMPCSVRMMEAVSDEECLPVTRDLCLQLLANVTRVQVKINCFHRTQQPRPFYSIAPRA